ncbi:MAG: ROK family protein [Candidatus Peribacteraceae bacterium]|nr:ROK family protein [Candidatus Peribacteraceae bacterium]MDD5739442.1 ROK family protein [Candidatus Peribacteraceae bacterium]
MPSVLGIDLGGTKLAIARYTSGTWQKQDERILPTAGKTFPVIVKEMLTLIKEFRTGDTKAIGVGVPGLIERDSGKVRAIPNIPEGNGFPLLTTLKNATKLPVFIENDSACFALAEALQGAGKGQSVVVGITMGTGVGGGIVVDGKIFRGNHGCSAEFGHMLLKPGESPASGGTGRGEVEEYLSGTALRHRCPAAKRPEETLEGPTCAHLHETVIREIAWMCTSLTHCIDPGVIIFGGSAGRALKPHLSEIEKELKRWMLPKSPLPTLTIGTLDHAGTLGAALLAG